MGFTSSANIVSEVIGNFYCLTGRSFFNSASSDFSFYNIISKFQDGTVKCIEDEIPFEVPEGWAWTFLSNIVSILNGDRGQNYPAKSKLQSEGIPFVSASNINDGVVSSNDLLCLSDSQYNALGAGKLVSGDIVYCIRGSLGKCGLFTMEKGAIASSLVIVRSLLDASFITGYIFLYLNSDFAAEEIKKYDNGSAQPNLAAKDFMHFLVPLPPQTEMQRINKQAREALGFVKCIQNGKDELNTTIAITKAKILDLAIRGQLVPQNPNDEPASVLLERIRSEKEELIKQGKIKRDKKESIIFKGEDNSYYLSTSDNKSYDAKVPFGIPDSWYWTRLRDVFIVNPRNKLDDDLDVSFIPMPLIDDGYSGKHTAEVCQWKEVKAGFTHFSEGVVGVAKITPCFENRKSTIFMNLTNGYGAGTTELHILRPIDSSIFSQYLLAYLKSDYFVENGKQTFTGAVGQQRISKEYIENAYFPLPPNAEQERIVQKINKMFKYLNVISEALT